VTVDVPTTRYARSGDIHIAYQVVGDGPIDLLYVPTWISQVEHLWASPIIAGYLNRLAAFSRLTLFDRRGSGLSDPMSGAPTLEDQMDDVLAVLDAAGADRAAVFAQLEGGPMAMLFAASFPERTSALMLCSTFARTVQSDDLPWGRPAAEREAGLGDFLAEWGTGRRLAVFAPSATHDPEVVKWFGKLERLTASPGSVPAISRLTARYDVRAVLPTIRVPTLVMNRRNDPLIDPRHASYIAERIPGARHVELPPGDSVPAFDGGAALVASEMEEFLTGARPERERERVLATVLFTDIVDSTRQASEIGDRRWRTLLERHDAVARGEFARFRGHEVKRTGDGFLATFDGPARAIRCAEAIDRAVAELGLRIRSGLHTGEVELVGDDIAGVAVHIGARVLAAAQPGEVLASSTVKELVVGSGIEFTDRGSRELKGIPGEWRLFAVDPAREPDGARPSVR
jgi:class 3 adenylate cyclase